MSKVVDVIEGKTFNIDKLGDDCYVFDFHQHRSHIWLDDEEMRDIADTFTKCVFDLGAMPLSTKRLRSSMF